MSSDLKNTSYVVLGLIAACEPATPYDLKQFAQISVFKFWTIPHTQLYAECARLAETGHLKETREDVGRRRRIYSLTDLGREALDRWRADSSFSPLEYRDPGLLKLFFGADPSAVAREQLEGHRKELAELEQLNKDIPEMPEGMRLALKAGIGFERHYVRFWSELLAD